jgi:hypothetical protein
LVGASFGDGDDGRRGVQWWMRLASRTAAIIDESPLRPGTRTCSSSSPLAALRVPQSKRKARPVVGRGLLYALTSPKRILSSAHAHAHARHLTSLSTVSLFSPPLPLHLTHYYFLCVFYKRSLVPGATDLTYLFYSQHTTKYSTWIRSIRPPRTACRAHLRATRCPMMALVRGSLFHCINHGIDANKFQALSNSTHGLNPSPEPCALATQKPKNGSRSWTLTRVDWRSSHAAMSALASPSHPTTQSHTASGPQALCVHT